MAAAAESSDPWMAELQRYAAQENLQNDRPYANESSEAPQVRFQDLLRALPEPADWPQLRRTLEVSTSALPPGVERERLQAGRWLLDYLLGDRAVVLTDLQAAPATPDSPHLSHAFEYLRASLAAPDRDRPSPDEQLRSFERQLQALEPVDETEVKRALGGEENFARLQRLIAAGAAMEEKAGQVIADYERNKDEASTREKMAALEAEFEAMTAEDTEALASYLDQPIINRYLLQLHQQEMTEDYVPSLWVPDLVTFAGPARAEELLVRALGLRVDLSINEQSGAETGKLARELALAAIETLEVPSWGLAHDTSATALFAAMHRRFPTVEPDDYGYQQACGYYLAGLIQQGSVSEAVAFASRHENGGDISLTYGVLNLLEESGQAGPLWDFLRGWLVKYPAAHAWDRFNRLSVQLGRQDELKAMLNTMEANGTFNDIERSRVQRMQADSELATDDLTAATARLQAIVQRPAETWDEREAQLEIAVKLLQLADLQEDPAGFALALAAAETALEHGWAEHPGDAFNGASDLVTTLNSLARFAEGARLGRAALARLPALKKQAAEQSTDADEQLYLPEYTLRALLGEQLRAEVELGHWLEAAALIEESPWWGVGDVSGLLREKIPSNRRPVGYYLARVSQQQGNDALTRRILEAQLVVTPGVDAVYESYLGLIGQDASTLLAKLAEADRYEERPLIWRAWLQSNAGDWDAAIATLQEAIGIDPSDGEQGPGDRMRVYAFMSRAMEGKGDHEKAKFYADVVKAIRLSETADRWYDVGAYARAIALYRQSLEFFQDAYCVQSRLAVRLSGEGRMDAAAHHYQRAFELMPDSFGRVESHCFGCEQVFAGEFSQGVAEKVFTRLLAARPDKPQTHYLLGYLRQEQKHLAEAAEHYRKAVELDPLYLNAWNRLASLVGQMEFTAAQRDDLFLKLLELDPTSRHVSPDLQRVSDLPRLWRAMKEARRIVEGLPRTEELWELKASALELSRSQHRPNSWTSNSAKSDAASVLLQHPFVQALQSYLAALNVAVAERP